MVSQVLVYKMWPLRGRGVSFNFNKLRAMVAARVLVGIQLDTDQLITPGLDRMFASTRREIHEHYPWLMLPVHWMSRDAKPGELYHARALEISCASAQEMNFNGWKGPRTMRRGRFLTETRLKRLKVGPCPPARASALQVTVAPRSWTFWSLPFILDLLHERFVASSKPGKIKASIRRCWSPSARSGTCGLQSTSA